MKLKSSLVIFLAFILSFSNAYSQKKYQGLLWKISGNGLEKPSYMYGTMHVSNKIAFYLGSPFYDALKSTDKVALELEPELWFDEVLGGDFLSYTLRATSSMSKWMNFKDSWNEYEGTFKLDTNTRDNIKALFKQSPEMMNQLLFRFQDRTGNFEESTWLDMHIYQTAKKFNKPTFGLETFKSSMEMMQKANEESVDEKKGASKLKFNEIQDVRLQIENAYRDGDLDLLDSLNKLLSTPSTTKYILVERNKTFIKSIDSLLADESLFIAMGAAHLPGDEGCIEMLRERGYTVEPYARGKRDGKQMKKIEKMVVKQNLIKYTSPDGLISFESPYKSYNMDFIPGTSGIVSMDIANGLTYTISRVMTHNNLFGKTNDVLMKEVDEILYEMVPGEIISKKSITNNGVKGFDIYNKTGKGDIHRSQLFFLENEIVLVKLSGARDKIKKGVGDYFFSTLKIMQNPDKGWENRTTVDQSIKFIAPGRLSAYGIDEDNKLYGNLLMEFNHDNDVYLVKRFACADDDFLDEDNYELFKLSEAFKVDLDLESNKTEYFFNKLGYGLTETYNKFKGKDTYATFRINGKTCYAFISFSNTRSNADKFFSSINISNPKSSINEEYIDSSLFFISTITWKKKEDSFSGIFGNLFNFGLNNKELTEADEYTVEKNISNPQTTEEIYVRYYRYGKYDYFDSTAAYEKEIRRIATEGNDFVIEKEIIKWDNDNMLAEFWMSDTATTKRIHRKELLNNHSLHTIEVTYDSITGESDFVKNFIANFEPIHDTLCAKSLFIQKDSLLLHDIMSEDTTLFEQANKNIEYINRNPVKTQFEFYKTLNDSFPPLAKENDIEEYKNSFVDLQYVDDSKENIFRLKKEYYNNIDSASYQKDILNNLSKMNNSLAVKTIKELLINEPPIGIKFYKRYGLFDNLNDSLELSKTLFPELLQLTNYDEYKTHVIRLLATLVDSNEINKNVYLKNIPYLLREAKAELKRSASGYEEDDALFLNKNNELYNYWSILYPHKKRPEVKNYFSLVEQSNKKNIIASYANFRAKKGQKIPDDICKLVIEDGKHYENYITLEKINRTDYLTDTIDLESSFIEYSIKEEWNYSYSDEDKVDSIQFIDSRKDTIRTRYYNTHYYKYYKKEKWYVMVVMLKQKNKMTPKFTVLKDSKTIDDEDDQNEVLENLRLKIISKNRDNGYLKNNDYEYDDYDEIGLDFDF